MSDLEPYGDVPYEWDPDVVMAGSMAIHWSVTLDEHGQLTGYISPYSQMPIEDEDAGWTGTALGLNQPLRSHPNHEMAAAAQTFAEIAFQQWIKPTLTVRIYKALVEQRDRQGGYMAGLKVFDQEKEEPDSE